MSSFMKFLNSSNGKKLMMAITGSFLLIFLIIHLIGNITLFFGPSAFNGYVGAMDVVKPLIRVIEVFLLTAFMLHIYNGTSCGRKIEELAVLSIRLMALQKKNCYVFYYYFHRSGYCLIIPNVT